ncbi:protein of unknown function [Pseudomonas sp. ok272]|uniref:DUF4123 domain-containing protein n=1 Tax=unclassified Pseudomonas TaxID=196821 RepID=UPI0008C235FA|nr:MULTISPECIES: DUF4123 domain-containing protein [unclassified Pseudomonas]SEN68997.1 protein of unknown function [Pseudomonas sp. ok272]SFN36084.1 protein of unknown function [Pseudomonas sp. ok602]
MSAAPITAWLGVLEAMCRPVGITCLDVIVDQAGSATPLLPSLPGVEPALSWHSLFTGRPEEGAGDVAPLLIRVDLTQPLQRQWLSGLLQHLNVRAQVLVLASPWDFQPLAEHLGHCLQASNGGYPGLLRYYDPRLFALLFSHVLQPQEQQRWLQPVAFWSWLDRDGQPRCLAGQAQGPDSAEPCAPLELSDSQLESLGCASDASLALTVMEAAFPADWGAERRFQISYASMLAATEAGVLLPAERETVLLDTLRNAHIDPPQTERS